MKKLGNTILVYVDDEQAAWLDEKVEQGYKKGSFVRFLIKECMARESTRNNPVEIKRLRMEEDVPEATGSPKSEPGEKPEHTAKAVQSEGAGKVQRVRRRAKDGPESFNSIPYESYKVEGEGPVNVRDTEAEVIVWGLEHPDEKMPKDLYDRWIQKFIDWDEERKKALRASGVKI